MEISFVIPTRNRPENILVTVNSLLELIRKYSLNGEIVIRDTSDQENFNLIDLGSKSVVLNYLYVEECSGAAENLRSAIDISKGKYIKVLNDSCIVTERFFIEYLSLRDRLDEMFVLWCSLGNTSTEHLQFPEFIVEANVSITWFNALGFNRMDWEYIKTCGIDKGITIHEFSWIMLNIASRYASFSIYDGSMIKSLPTEMKGEYSFYDQFGRSYLARVLEFEGLNWSHRLSLKWKFFFWCLHWEKKALIIPNRWDFSSRKEVLLDIYGKTIERIFHFLRYIYVLYR